jgi:hypothetical protein
LEVEKVFEKEEVAESNLKGKVDGAPVGGDMVRVPSAGRFTESKIVTCSPKV